MPVSARPAGYTSTGSGSERSGTRAWNGSSPLEMISKFQKLFDKDRGDQLSVSLAQSFASEINKERLGTQPGSSPIRCSPDGIHIMGGFILAYTTSPKLASSQYSLPAFSPASRELLCAGASTPGIVCASVVQTCHVVFPPGDRVDRRMHAAAA